MCSSIVIVNNPKFGQTYSTYSEMTRKIEIVKREFNIREISYSLTISQINNIISPTAVYPGPEPPIIGLPEEYKHYALIMFYCPFDNNLEQTDLLILKQAIQKFVNSEDDKRGIILAVFVDLKKGYGYCEFFGWGYNGKYYHEIVNLTNEINSGDYKTLQSFIENTRSFARRIIKEDSNSLSKLINPIYHSVLFFWDHGGAWRGFGYDTNPIDHLTPLEIRAAIINTFHINCVIFLACKMGVIETAYALRGCFDYMIANVAFLRNIEESGLKYDFISCLRNNLLNGTLIHRWFNEISDKEFACNYLVKIISKLKTMRIPVTDPIYPREIKYLNLDVTLVLDLHDKEIWNNIKKIINKLGDTLYEKKLQDIEGSIDELVRTDFREEIWYDEFTDTKAKWKMGELTPILEIAEKYCSNSAIYDCLKSYIQKVVVKQVIEIGAKGISYYLPIYFPTNTSLINEQEGESGRIYVNNILNYTNFTSKEYGWGKLIWALYNYFMNKTSFQKPLLYSNTYLQYDFTIMDKSILEVFDDINAITYEIHYGALCDEAKMITEILNVETLDVANNHSFFTLKSSSNQ